VKRDDSVGERLPVSLRDCWAKTNERGEPTLTVLSHSLNVGAVAERVHTSLPRAVANALPDGGIALAAAHDIGKISPGFLLKSLGWRDRWQKELKLLSPTLYESNHARAGQHFLRKRQGGKDLSRWVLCVGGHHGIYAGSSASIEIGPEGSEPWPDLLRESLLATIMREFGPLPSETTEGGSRVHLLTGFITFSDWIGSNEEWFPVPSVPGTETSREVASERAARAIEAIGWDRREVVPDRSFDQLFAPGESADRFEPRPLQTTLIEAMDRPGLYILEAPMGEGKTEAALAGAYRRWTEGGESGLYFALPTQLTSNRIHLRIGDFLADIATHGSAFALAHGSAWLSNERITALKPTAAREEGAAEGNRWFADARRALLAPFGVGTVDQVLMSVLAVKHSSVRFFGLAGKVIVLDEVHSYDPYTSALIDRSVSWLLEVGCSVIVLSATLTRRRRNELTRAAGGETADNQEAYPLLTRVGRGGTTDYFQPAGCGTASKTVMIDTQSPDDTAFLAAAAEAAEGGACVLIVRNTVALAQQTLRAVNAQLRELEIPTGLLHSRFPRFMRDQQETDWMRRLGKEDADRPRGSVLVATQVVEQSVDIDADLLITDLAPTDLILQRMGRLHRHARQRPESANQPRCFILVPEFDADEDPDAIRRAMGPSACVYPPFRLYQARETLCRRRSVRLPDQIREILEESAACEHELPSGPASLKADLEASVDRMVSTAFQRGPFSVQVDDATETQTRWGSQHAASMVLLRETPRPVDGGIELAFLDGTTHRHTPGRFDFELSRCLHRNAVQVPWYTTRDLMRSGRIDLWFEQHLQGGLWATCPPDTTDCLPFAETGISPFHFSFHPSYGIEIQKQNTQPAPEQEDESWF